ncbi:glyoxylate/hydroxypyruvate reductase A [bacterium BD-1]|nr:glyoxylate/hydroxypyruvate reductase A [Ottowia caeni]
MGIGVPHSEQDDDCAIKPILLVKSGGETALPEWRELFGTYAPFLDVRSWDDISVDPEHVKYALVWQPEPGRLASYPNLRLVLSSAAGVDHITTDPTWPKHLPLLRASTDESAQRMGEYVCLAALALLKDLPRLVKQQTAKDWQPFETVRSAPETQVGILGLGKLGLRCASMLMALGFQVSSWSRSAKRVDGVRSYTGEEGLRTMLLSSHIVVCLLPSTPETAGMLNRDTLALLPEGAGLINVARGSHVVRDDMMAALDSARLSGAVLDVFEQEPLPPDDALWRHPRVLVTPHIASIASRRARVEFFCRQIAAHRENRPLEGVFDISRGY